MAGGTKGKTKRGGAVKAARMDVVSKRQVPWGTVIAAVLILAFGAFVVGYYWVQSAPQREQENRNEAAAAFKPTDENQDPSKQIDGVVIEEYKAAGHVQPDERVAYNEFPPFGGPHDGIWADCNGTVYEEPVRNENMVHTLEHGAVWIAYNPDKVDEEGVRMLETRVNNKAYTVMSPYPGLDKPISVQAWGHQLKVDDAADQRIDNFIVALRTNPYNTPEANATCDAAPGFDVSNPPPFDGSKPGKDAKPMDFSGQAGQMGGAPAQPAPTGDGSEPADSEPTDK